MPRLRPPTRLEAAALVAVPAEVALNLPLWDLDARAPVAATAAGIAIAAVAGALGGALPALAAVAVGWPLNLVFVADGTRDALLALPAWLAGAGAAAAAAEILRRRSEERRREASTLEAVRQATSDAVVGLDGEGTIVSWSPGAERLYGYSGAEIVGRPADDLFGGTDAASQASRFVEAVGRGERFADEVLEQRRRDGSVWSASVSLTPMGLDEAMLVAQDVGALRRLSTDLRDVEARYRSLIEHLPVVTYVRSLDGEGHLGRVSPQIERLVGYGPDELLADPGLLLRLVHPEDRDRVAGEQAGGRAEGWRSNYRLVARDGRVVWVRDEAAVVRDEGGRPLCLQGYLLDVSERSELRATGAAAAAEARDRQRKVEFVAEAASALASSLDFRATVADVARLAVRDIADWAVVDVREEDGTLTRLVAERAPSASPLFEPEPTPEEAVANVVRTQAPELSTSRICLPLVSRGGRAVGALTLVGDGEGRRFDPADLP